MIRSVREAGSGRRRAEDGASAVVFLLSFFALLAVAMIAIDGGLLYLSERGQVADTDAAALAAASAMLDESGSCSTAGTRESAASGQAALYAATNDSETSIVDFQVTYDSLAGADCRSGTVVVQTEHPAGRVFSGAFGFGETDTVVASVARFGQRNAAEGVRPIGICATEPHVIEWRTGGGPSLADAQAGVDPDHPNDLYSGASGLVHRFEIEPASGSPCAAGGGNGNWGFIDFDAPSGGTGGGTADLRDQIENGYGPGVDLGLPGLGDNDCDYGTPGTDNPSCGAESGAGGGALRDALNTILCAPPTATASCEDKFYIVVYDEQNELSGANTEYRLTSLAYVVLRGYSRGLTGNPATGDYLDIEFLEERDSGLIGGFDPNSTAPLGVELCGVNEVQNCDP